MEQGKQNKKRINKRKEKSTEKIMKKEKTEGGEKQTYKDTKKANVRMKI